MSGIAKLVPHLSDANASDLLARAAHRTKSEIEALIAQIAPKPDVPAVIRKMPLRGRRGERARSGSGTVATNDDARCQLGLGRVGRARKELGPDRVEGRASGSPLLPPATAARVCLSGRDMQLSSSGSPMPSRQTGSVTALSPDHYKVQFTAHAELRDKLERLQEILRNDLVSVIEAAVTEKLARFDAKRFALTGAMMEPGSRRARQRDRAISRQRCGALSMSAMASSARFSCGTVVGAPSAATSSFTSATRTAGAAITIRTMSA